MRIKPTTARQLRHELRRLEWLEGHPYAAHVAENNFALGAMLALEFTLGKQAAQPSAALTAAILEALTAARVPHCRVCACVYIYACPEGCAWATRPAADGRGLCSACQAKLFLRRRPGKLARPVRKK